MEKLTKKQEDALREMANIGSGNASTALSKIIGMKVKITVPSANIIPVDELGSLIIGPKAEVVGIYAPVTGGVIGNILMIYPVKDSLMLMDFIEKKQPGTSKELTAVHKKKILEIGEATSTSYLEAINGLLSLNAKKGNSKIIVTEGASIANFIKIGVGGKDYALVLRAETGFDLPDLNIKGEFILVLSIKEIDKLSKKLSEKEAGGDL